MFKEENCKLSVSLYLASFIGSLPIPGVSTQNRNCAIDMLTGVRAWRNVPPFFIRLGN